MTTYTSAPQLYGMMTNEHSYELVIHDEAHHNTEQKYSAAYENVKHRFAHTVNLSATLKCPLNDIHFKYSLLRGIQDKVVRDFLANVFICTKQERESESSNVIIQIVEQLQKTHEKVN